jgi:hypothetical protein
VSLKYNFLRVDASQRPELFRMVLSAYGRAMYDKGTLGEPLKRDPLYDNLLSEYERVAGKDDDDRISG